MTPLKFLPKTPGSFGSFGSSVLRTQYLEVLSWKKPEVLVQCPLNSLIDYKCFWNRCNEFLVEEHCSLNAARSGAYVEKVNLIFTFGGSLDLANLWIISYESNTQFVTYNLHLGDAPGDSLPWRLPTSSVLSALVRERMREGGRWNLAGALAMYTGEQYKLRTTFWIKQSLLNFLLLGCFETFETSQTLNSIEQHWTAISEALTQRVWTKRLWLPRKRKSLSEKPTGPVVGRKRLQFLCIRRNCD